MGKIKESRLAARRQRRTQSILPGFTFFPFNNNGMRANRETFAPWPQPKKIIEDKQKLMQSLNELKTVVCEGFVA